MYKILTKLDKRCIIKKRFRCTIYVPDMFHTLKYQIELIYTRRRYFLVTWGCNRRYCQRTCHYIAGPLVCFFNCQQAGKYGMILFILMLNKRNRTEQTGYENGITCTHK